MAGRPGNAMWGRLFVLSNERGRPLQAQIRETIVSAIADRHLCPGSPLPSSRELAEQLKVARNTVSLAYGQLVDEGFLVARERSGYYVNADLVAPPLAPLPAPPGRGVDWERRLAVRASVQRNIVKPRDWQAYPYPFLYGQFDPAWFPIAEWRECCRQALGVVEVRGWAPDLIDGDDPLLIEQLRTKVLPGRGVWAAEDEIMVTIGAQQALFLLAELLVSAHTVVGVEDPGYPDARNIFAIKTPHVRALAVDGEGLVPGGTMAGCHVVYATPSHQCPTTVTMPLARREALLALAGDRDLVVIEDDYETDSGAGDTVMPALKSLDRDARVVYVGSLSKTLAPGLRLGYIVGPAPLVREARALRRLMLRHPPANNQRAAALFIALGHHEALQRRRRHVHRDRAEALRRALDRHLPDWQATAGAGGSSLWVRGPEGRSARGIAERARAHGVLVEPGDVFFMDGGAPDRHLRLGFSSIAAERIDAGIAALAAAAR
ncbi:MocR-like pyridoxine biosynthesis transcription factor PdxR [Azospirillum sp. ST 5-10]|uniref:MocR-like pyridoxine biosynthesis transcription factor PdxR n=1 Tax=unclassified Azospirillum TaxID=2630922 RepID=UPI003F4A247A